jgi:hypothetical protein
MGDQTSRYPSVVQGRKITPKSGQTHESNASSTRSPKIHQASSATRGPRNPAVKTRQHMARDYLNREGSCPETPLRFTLAPR